MLKTAIYTLWILFWIYWLGSAFSAKKTIFYRTGRQLSIRLAIILFVIIVVSVSAHSSLFTGQHLKHYLWLKSLGTLFFALGIGLAIWARVHLGKNWGMPMTIKQDPELVTSGPYGIVRHPIYSGLLLAIFGTALAVDYYWLYVLMFIAIYFIYSAVIEEKDMNKTFPKEYPQYKASTKMLVPYIF